MVTEQILELLIAERDKINEAINALDGGTATKRMVKTDPTVPAPPLPVRRKRKFTAAQRLEQAARMKAYWAKKRKAK